MVKNRGFIYIVIAGILWGTSGIYFNLLSGYGFKPIDMTAMRGGVALFAMPLYVLITDRKLFRVTLKELILFSLGGTMIFMTAWLYYEAIKASSVSTAVILMYTAPIFVMIYSVVFLGEKLTRIKTAAIFLVLCGCALVSGITGGISFSLAGILLGLLSGLTYSAYIILTKIGAIKGYNSVSSSLYCFIVMGIIALASVNRSEFISVCAQNPAVIVPLIIGIGLFTCVVPYFLCTLALKSIPAGTAASLSVIEPMSATVFSVVFFHEHLSIPSFFGIILILSAVLLLSKAEND